MSADEEQRSALVVAVWKYKDARFRQLRSPSADAEALARVLADHDVGRYAVETSLNEDQSRVARRLERFFTDRGRHDQLLLHLSCHGVKDADGELYFAASDTELHLLNTTAIPASLLSKLVNRSEAGRVVVFLDCCYSGAFTGDLIPRADDDVQVVERFARAGAGRAVITASKATEYAFEDNELSREDPRPSVFTSALVNGLTTGDADLDRDGLISFSDIYAYVYDEVRKVTKHQTPGVFTKLEGRLYIADSRRPAELPGPLQEAIENPLPTVRTAAVDELARLLRGSHPGHAAAAGRALSTLAAEDRDLVVRDAAREALERAGLPPGPPPPPPPPPKPPPTDASDGRQHERRRWRLQLPRWGWIAAAAGLVLAAVTAAAFAVLRDGEGDDPLTWTAVDAAAFDGAQTVNGLAASQPAGRIVAVGTTGEGPAVWSMVAGGGWRPDALARSPARIAFNAASVSSGTVEGDGAQAVAVGRSGPAGRGQGAAIWAQRTGRWSGACAPKECGDAAEPLGDQRKQEMYGVAALPNTPAGFVAVGIDQMAAGGGRVPIAAVWRLEDDGARRVDFDRAPRQELRAVVARGRELTAVGHDAIDAAVWRSTDGGATWIRLDHGDAALQAAGNETFRMYDAVWRGTDLVVVGYIGDQAEARKRAAVWTRHDNGTWERGTSPGFERTEQILRGVAVTLDGELLVAAGSDGGRAAVWTSSDGVRWDKREGAPPGRDAAMHDVAVFGGSLVAVGRAGSGDASVGRVWTAELQG